jgi:cytoskeletal protein CcmA (bactofilin family)
MFTKRKHAASIDSLIGVGSRIEGNVSFTGGLRVDGEIRGNIRSVGDKPGTLVVSERARIEGEIHVDYVVINGEVVGPVHAKEAAELMPRARVAGDVVYKAIEVHTGAVVAGRLMHADTTRSTEKVVELKELKQLTPAKAT